MPPPLSEKACPRCRRTLSVFDFARNKSTKDGHQTYCRSCVREVRLEKILEKRLDGLPPDLFQCKTCLQTLPVGSFIKAKGRKSGLREECKACYHIRRQEWANGYAEAVVQVESKRCSKCKEIRPAAQFGRDRNRPDQLNPHCNACRYSAGRLRMIDEQKVAERDALRRRVQLAYGGRCKCCSLTDPWCLSVDHIRGVIDDGSPRGGDKLWRWLERNGYPTDNYQLLCDNCNLAKYRHGECPHERERKNSADEWMESW